MGVIVNMIKGVYDWAEFRHFSLPRKAKIPMGHRYSSQISIFELSIEIRFTY
jgi:hypothetical protein